MKKKNATKEAPATQEPETTETETETETAPTTTTDPRIGWSVYHPDDPSLDLVEALADLPRRAPRTGNGDDEATAARWTALSVPGAGPRVVIVTGWQNDPADPNKKNASKILVPLVLGADDRLISVVLPVGRFFREADPVRKVAAFTSSRDLCRASGDDGIQPAILERIAPSKVQKVQKETGLRKDAAPWRAKLAGFTGAERDKWTAHAAESLMFLHPEASEADVRSALA